MSTFLGIGGDGRNRLMGCLSVTAEGEWVAFVSRIMPVHGTSAHKVLFDSWSFPQHSNFNNLLSFIP